MNNRSAFAMGLALVWVAAIPAQAGSVIFSNLGPNDSYYGGGGWALGSYNFMGVHESILTGCQFTVGTTANLATIEVAAGLGFSTGTNQLTIDLDADSGGSPGSVIESFTISGAMPALGTFSMGHLVAATSVLHPLLTAGSQYWVVLSIPNAGETNGAWNDNSTGDVGPVEQSSVGGTISGGNSLNLRGAMRITALSSVPEPSSIAMMGASTVVIVGCGLRRRSIAKAA
jgi:hypothetical protein